MRYLFFLASFILFHLQGLSQSFFVDNGNFNQENLGMLAYKPFATTSNKYEKVSQGSPWLRSYWCRAFMTDATGKTFAATPIKIDLVEDKLLYMEKGQEMEVVTPIMYLTAIDSVTRDTLKMVRAEYYRLNEESNIKGWMQVYELGEAILLHDLNKTLHVNKAYNSAVTEFQVMDYHVWVLLLEGIPYKIKKLKDAQAVLIAKKPEMKGFKAAAQGLEPQLRLLVKAYNSL
jgi:hypothetical protein